MQNSLTTFQEIGQQHTLTATFLRNISNLLSSREDCKQEIYTVTISNSVPQQIVMYPIRYVYKDLHHKSLGDRLLVLEKAVPDGVLLKPFIVDGVVQGKRFVIHKEILIPGTYQFCYIESYKNRHWIKIA